MDHSQANVAFLCFRGAGLSFNLVKPLPGESLDTEEEAPARKVLTGFNSLGREAGTVK